MTTFATCSSSKRNKWGLQTPDGDGISQPACRGSNAAAAPSPVRRHLHRACRIFVSVLVIGGCHHAPPSPEPTPDRGPDAPTSAPIPAAVSPDEDDVASTLGAKHLMVPVEGVTPEKVPDTYNAPRAAGAHRALDILAPRGTPVLAADAGRVYRLRSNPNGGTTIYATDQSEQFIYYYAHLDRYREGLAEGDALEAGDVIGYVGTTGNAPPNVPHLHFQIMRFRHDGRYWDGEPINPHAYLVRCGTRRMP